jgi:hypothetical protein
MIIAYSECASVALVIQHAMRMRHIAICGLPRFTIFFHIISQTTRFSKKKLLIIKCVFRVSLQRLSEMVFIFRITERDMIENVYCSCPILMKLEISRRIFEKYSNIKFHKNPSGGSRGVHGWMDGQT